MTLLRALDRNECRHVDYLEQLSGLGHKTVVRVVGRLILRRYAERAEQGCYLLTLAGDEFLASGQIIKSGPRGKLTGRSRRPKRQTIRDRIWGALRIRNKATVPELIELASAGDQIASVDNVRNYLRALRIAGYVRELKARQPGTAETSNGFKRYQLTTDTGPEAPQLRVRTKSLYDPNTETVISLQVTA